LVDGERSNRASGSLTSQSDQIEIIHRAYQKLREKDNEIRNNLKLMDIKLAHIVGPIKSAGK